MHLSFSFYLDGIRVLAALLVFFSHLKHQTNLSLPIYSYGHQAVVVFFVLSGLVIAFSTGKKKQQVKEYFISRIARIYSVAIPAILLTIAFDALGNSVSPLTYTEGYDANDLAAVRIPSSLLFLNELWFFSIQLFSNIPYWSLNYEVWYYIAFGVLVFSPRAYRIPLFFLVVLIAGIKIALMLPIWLMGVGVWKSISKYPLQRFWLALPVFLGSLFGIVGFFATDVTGQLLSLEAEFLGADFVKSLAYSKWFLADWCLGVLVALHFYSMQYFTRFIKKIPNVAVNFSRVIADASFSLYLVHQPIILLLVSLLPMANGDQYFTLTLLTLSLVGVSIFYYLTKSYPVRIRTFLRKL